MPITSPISETTGKCLTLLSRILVNAVSILSFTPMVMRWFDIFSRTSFFINRVSLFCFAAFFQLISKIVELIHEMKNQWDGFVICSHVASEFQNEIDSCD